MTTKEEQILINGLLIVALIFSIFISGYWLGRMLAYAIR